MSSSTSSFNRRRIGGLLAAAAAVAALELLLASVPEPERRDFVRHRFYSPHLVPGVAESVVQWQVAHASLLQERQDLLLLGDSACLSGLDAGLLMERTGLRTWNLGTFGFTYTDGHADILDLFIAVNGPPRFLIYHTSHYPLTTGFSSRSVRTYLSRLREWLAPPERPRHPLPSLRRRQEIRDFLLSRGTGEVAYTGLDRPRGEFGSDEELRRELLEGRGTLLPVGTGVDTGDRFEAPMRWGPRFHPDCLEGLRRIFATAAEHGFPVLILFNPLPEAAANEFVRRAMNELEAKLDEVVRPWPGVSIHRPFIRWYPDGLCQDMRHLTRTGTRRQSEELAEWIRENWLYP